MSERHMEKESRLLLATFGVLQVVFAFPSWNVDGNNRIKEIYKKSLIPGIVSLIEAWKYPDFKSFIFSAILTFGFLGWFYKNLPDSEKSFKDISRLFWINCAIAGVYFVMGYWIWKKEDPCRKERKEVEKFLDLSKKNPENLYILSQLEALVEVLKNCEKKKS